MFVGIQIVFTIVFLYYLFNFAVLPNIYMYGIIASVIILCLITFYYSLNLKISVLEVLFQGYLQLW